jgi:hypothetical protein
LETKQAATANVGLADVTPYLKNSVVCPAAGINATISDSYITTTVSQAPTCKIDAVNHVLPTGP